jgi:hypothetical protein
MKLTRRQLAATIATAPLLAVEQQTPAQPEDLDAAARARLKSNTTAIDAVALPMATEPAFAFKVQ